MSGFIALFNARFRAHFPGANIFKKECEMKQRYTWILAAFLFAVLFPAASVAQTGDPLYLVAAKDSRVKAQKWIDFLKLYDQPVEHYVLSELDMVKDEDYIAIAGGLDEAGFRELLVNVIGEDEVDSLEKADAGKMLLKENVWKPGQKVLVFAGKDPDAAAEARNKSRDIWMEYLEDWFDLEEIPGGLRAY
jgi:hypothetical protein